MTEPLKPEPDLTVFFAWTVVGFQGPRRAWCRCACGTTQLLSVASLEAGEQRGCCCRATPRQGFDRPAGVRPDPRRLLRCVPLAQGRHGGPHHEPSPFPFAGREQRRPHPDRRQGESADLAELQSRVAFFEQLFDVILPTSIQLAARKSTRTCRSSFRTIGSASKRPLP